MGEIARRCSIGQNIERYGTHRSMVVKILAWMKMDCRGCEGSEMPQSRVTRVAMCQGKTPSDAMEKIYCTC
jgi:hypothetical protein